MEYYNTLGVAKTASDAEIKAAYRKLAMKHHPDRGGDEAQFKNLNTAYETLSDPEKRRMYDLGQQPGQHHHQQHGGFNFYSENGGFNVDIEELFRRHMGGGFRPQQQRKNRDIITSVKMSLADTLVEQKKSFNVTLSSGKTESIEIVIPVGIPTNGTIHYPLKGDDQFPNLPRGDLIIRLEIALPDNYNVVGAELHSSVSVNALDAMTGADVDFKNFDNKTLSVKIPAGIQHGNVVKLRGQGIYFGSNSSTRNDLFLHIAVVVTKITDEKLIALIKQIKENQ